VPGLLEINLVWISREDVTSGAETSLGTELYSQRNLVDRHLSAIATFRPVWLLGDLAGLHCVRHSAAEGPWSPWDLIPSRSNRPRHWLEALELLPLLSRSPSQVVSVPLPGRLCAPPDDTS
jgi:hypothetical protein